MPATASIRAAADSRDLRLLALVVVVELCLLVVYFGATPAQVTQPRYVLYPFVWINVAFWVIRRMDPPRATQRATLLAGSVTTVYFVVLCWLAGLIGFTLAGNPEPLVGFNVGYGSPGWERVRLVTPIAHLTLIPFRVVGYLALAYLVYVTVLDATGAALSGAIGFVSCLSCGVPIVGSLATGLFGASAGVTGTLYSNAVDLSTFVFLLAVALLYYRPGFNSRRRDRETDETARVME